MVIWSLTVNRIGVNSLARPTLFKAEYVQKAAMLVKKTSASNKELAIHFGVHDRTFDNWLGEYPELAAAVNSARESLDSRVERSLAKRAIGFKGKATKIFRDNKTGEVVQVPFVEHYPPDTEAAKFWLTNRRPDRWRNKQEIEHTGNNQPAIGAEEAARLIAFTFAAALQQGAKPPVIELDATAIEQPRPNPFAD